MKKHLAPYLLGLLAAVSCGTSAQFAAGSQQFEDGIYADPRSEAPVAHLCGSPFGGSRSRRFPGGDGRPGQGVCRV